MKNVLILGGNGFIGKNLAEQLVRQGEAVTCFDLNPPQESIDKVRYIQGSFWDENKLEEITDHIDVVFHAVSSINPGTSNQKYMQGYSMDFIHTIKLCEIIKKKNIKMIFLSSGGTIYGSQVIQPIKEDAPAYPINHYGNVKLCMENTMRIFNRQNGTAIKIARIANPYGDGQNFEKGVGFIDAVLKNGLNHSTVEVYGNGEIIRDYIYIKDVCKMLCAIMDYQGTEEIFNLSSGIGTSQKQIIEFAKVWMPGLKIRYLNSRPIDVDKIVLDNAKIRTICNITPIPLFNGMHLYYQNLEYHIRQKSTT